MKLGKLLGALGTAVLFAGAATIAEYLASELLGRRIKKALKQSKGPVITIKVHNYNGDAEQLAEAVAKIVEEQQRGDISGGGDDGQLCDGGDDSKS